ncbi:MAG: hypothetical protein U9Q69_03190 [Nanoarchaeota archaeon]|nr:hypothetical protein [Nanoarchaeota archaeon]
MKGLLLLSGGFDSPVAGYLMRKKNVELTALHFSGEPFVKANAKEKAKLLAKKIGCTKIIIFPFGEIQAETVNSCRHRYYFIITKRIMFRIAQKFAEKEGCDFLVTGDNLGQVGSQTLINLSLINSAINIEVLQPLLCFDKQEIINLAKEIGTHDLSIGPEMCSLLGPKHPATRAKKEKIEIEEKKFNIEKLMLKGFEKLKAENLK